MSIICWNVRGLNGETRRLDLFNLRNKVNPTIIAFLENKMGDSSIQVFANMFGNDWEWIDNNSASSKGRILITWHKSIWNLSIKDKSEQHITVTCNNVGGLNFICTFVYAHNWASLRRQLWSYLVQTSKQINNNWMVMGDFNAVLKTNEKRGGSTLRLSQTEEFNKCVVAAGLSEAIHSGLKFTWFSGEVKKIACRLDRVLINDKILTSIPNLKISVLPSSTSDHSPLHIQFNQQANSLKGKPFRYGNHWHIIEGYADVVDFNNITKTDGNCWFSMVMMLRELKKRLKKWNRERNKTKDTISHLQQKCEQMQTLLDTDPLDDDRISNYFSTQQKLKEALHLQAIQAKQMAKEKWLTQGDECTKFFYAKMSYRRNCNALINSINDQGDIATNISQFEQGAISYFTNLYNSEIKITLPPINCRAIISDVGRQMLQETVTEEEVRAAVFSIHIDSSPGPDGWNSKFYQLHWQHLKNQLLEAIQESFNTGKILHELNHTFITLIPKVESPTMIEEFRPIACCNVLYKILSKVICNRLTKVLPDLISECQSAFIKGRHISENSLLAHELIRNFNKPGADKMCLKIDLQKAYDKINRQFIIHVLHCMNFPTSLINLIEECISTPTYSIIINGIPKGYITSNRGLRQGDPLSPYLFAVAMEFFTLQMELACHNSLIQPLFKHNPNVNHLLYADDLIIAIRASSSAAQGLLHIFDQLQLFVGLELNTNKSKCYFSKYCTSKNQILEILQIKEGQLPVKYLGVPLSTNVITDRECGELVGKIRDKLNGWSSKLLSFAGRIELVHTVITAKVRFWLQTFHIPDSSIEKIKSACANFIWRGGLHKVSYDILSRPKAEGGVGLINLKDLRKTYQIKHGWKILTSNTLWARWMRNRYIKGSFWTMHEDINSSGVWKCILRSREVLKTCISKRIANGRDTYLWRDPWINGKSFANKYGWGMISCIGEYDDLVASIIYQGTWIPEQKGLHAIAEDVKYIPIYSSEPNDTWTWNYTNDDIFTTNSTWEAIRTKHTNKYWAAHIWSRSNNPKMAFTTFKAINLRLPTADRLARWGMEVNLTCKLCNNIPESHNHLFFECEYSTRVLSHVKSKNRDMHAISTLEDELLYLSHSKKGDLLTQLQTISLTTTVYHLWKERNRRVFKSTAKGHKQIQIAIEQDVKILVRRIKGKLFTHATDLENKILREWKVDPP